MNCPHCGAPPPPGYVPPAQGQFSYLCTYCRQSSLQGTPVAPPPQAPQTGPILIVHHHGGYDDDHHYHQAAAHVHTANRISWLVWVIVVVVISLGGSGAAFARCAHGSSMVSSLVWDGKDPLVCGGNDNITVTGVTAKFNAGSAIVASANCHVKCTNCNLEGTTAIEASGNADVTIINGSVKGTVLMADASNNAHVTVMGNVVVAGETKKSGNAKISAPAAPAAPKAVPPAPPAATPVPAAKKK